MFDFISLEKIRLECEECGWMGKGYETEKGFMDLPEAIEICCPVCGNYLGEIRKATAENNKALAP
jgi:ribosomal protein L33